jgi:hypothetical protein
MSIKITSGASLDRMLNAIEQANRALDHNMEPNIKHDWAWLMASMVNCRKAAMKKNEKHKELTDAT